ncbi:hypothetical protein Theco_3996 (plasmid) [Thermobacillus composti KWC4]|jgi:hypothetical protein|uniref:Uncharacterized protein n=1 Tax=Thermobacillus composti (strain DSM 18247 / JCM 13945 / KWC4) TaxID=717605 RepID=L0EL35_THECK|nr:hypothetical protein [Thermobacillus composti]AGA60000.1 hypothetical protein Theco_3996 [Thermobacillus composti KWC4]
MALRVIREYQGGTLVVLDVPADEGKNDISARDAALIAQYVQFLNEKNILGDIEVTFSEIKQKFDS